VPNQELDIEISADPSYNDTELTELASAFGEKFKVRITRHQRFTGVSADQLGAVLFLILNSPIAKGFLEEFGKDVYKSVKERLIKVAKKQDNSEVVFEYTHGAKKAKLRVKSKNEKVLESAFNQIDDTVRVLEGKEWPSFYFDFDIERNAWLLNDTANRKVAFHIQGVVATTDTIRVRGKTMQINEEALKNVAAEMKGLPLHLEHSGPPIGEWVSARYENGKLIGKASIYEPRNEAERKTVEDIRTRKLGLSLGFNY